MTLYHGKHYCHYSLHHASMQQDTTHTHHQVNSPLQWWRLVTDQRTGSLSVCCCFPACQSLSLVQRASLHMCVCLCVPACVCLLLASAHHVTQISEMVRIINRRGTDTATRRWYDVSEQHWWGTAAVIPSSSNAHNTICHTWINARSKSIKRDWTLYRSSSNNQQNAMGLNLNKCVSMPDAEIIVNGNQASTSVSAADAVYKTV